jgi:soluble lytic murein transglycosylase-like protein
VAALSGRRGVVAVLVFLVLVVGSVSTLAVLALRQAATGLAADASPSAEVSVVPSAPSPPPSPAPSRRPSRPPSRKPRPKPSRRPVTVARPPSQSKPPSCPIHHSGTAAATGTVRSALTAAAAIRPWGGDVPVSVPLTLVRAVAWQESGWQSNVVSCIGALGVMQLTPSTADWMNQRFGRSDNVHTVSGNAALGSVYLQWLVKYFGDVYFQGSYDLTAVDPENPTLLDAVIAAYNVGFGAVDTAKGLKIPNRPYVNAVERWMSEQPWPA